MAQAGLSLFTGVRSRQPETTCLFEWIAGIGTMRHIIRLNADEIIPTREEVLKSQGMTGRKVPDRILALLDSAMELFRELAEPKGIFQQWPIDDFDNVFEGEGLNDPDGPVRIIVPKADAIALFVATLGDALFNKSSELFKQGGAALGYILDAVNSAAGEQLGKMMGKRFIQLLPEELRAKKVLVSQYYCPGHCGWHISGQEKLFEAVRPEEIGIDLKASHAMYPLKSISGVLIVGDMDIHRFKPKFSFCKDCKEHKCVERLAILENENRC
jgi:hypothetical protein